MSLWHAQDSGGENEVALVSRVVLFHSPNPITRGITAALVSAVPFLDVSDLLCRFA